MGGIDHQPFKIRVIGDNGQQPGKDAKIAPAVEAVADAFPIAKLGRQVTPWRSGPQLPQKRIQKQPVIPSTATPVALRARQMGLQPQPNFFTQIVTPQI
jgi:hypothetical protein